MNPEIHFAIKSFVEEWPLREFNPSNRDLHMALHPRVMLHETLFATAANCSGGALKIKRLEKDEKRCGCLIAEAVQGAALALERVHDVESRDSPAESVLRVGHGVAHDVLEKHLEHTAGLLVDEAADALDTTTASKAADGRLGDALDVVAEDLAVTAGAALADPKVFVSLSRHVEKLVDWSEK